jgi:hypothetical protein
MKFKIKLFRHCCHLLCEDKHGWNKSYIFWDITPCSPVKVNRLFRGPVASIFRVEASDKQENSTKQAPSRALFAAWFMLVSCFAYSSTLKVEVICSYEIPVDFHRATWRYISEKGNFHSHRYENLKFKTNYFFCIWGSVLKSYCSVREA